MRQQRKTRKVAPCSHCGTPIPPGYGRVWKCSKPGKCEAKEHCHNGWHASCLNESKCRKRVRQKHEDSLKDRSAPGDQLEMGIE